MVERRSSRIDNTSIAEVENTDSRDVCSESACDVMLGVGQNYRSVMETMVA